MEERDQNKIVPLDLGDNRRREETVGWKDEPEILREAKITQFLVVVSKVAGARRKVGV